MTRISEAQHRDIAFLGLSLVAIGLPLSTFLMSVGQFVLFGNWLIEGDYKRRLRQFFSNRLGLVLSSVFLMHVVGMVWAPDLHAAWRDVQVKLPLLLLPLVLFTSRMPDEGRMRQVLYLLVVATVAGSLVGLINYLGLSSEPVVEKRHLSFFTSHIRFGLMTGFSMLILGHFLYSEWNKWPWAERIFSLLIIGWLFYFLVLLESATAFLVFAALFALMLARAVIRSGSIALKGVSALVLAVSVASGFLYVQHIYEMQMLDLPFDKDELTIHTANGRKYEHYPERNYTENGYRIWNYMCSEELESEWPKRSALALYGKDLRGQRLDFTLIRYLTSKGLPKDSIGVHSLSDEDISNVEKGFSNFRYTQRWGVSRRIAESFWGVKEYVRNGNPNSSSLVQRWVYTLAGWQIVKENWLLGVGTEGLVHAYKELYARDSYNLKLEYQLIAHNQFLATTICLGVFGGLWLIVAFLYPLVRYWKDFLYLGFVVMMGIAFLSDNTLGSQAGVTLYAFLNALLIVISPIGKHVPPVSD